MRNAIYMTINKDSQLYEDFFLYKEDFKKIDQAFEEMRQEFGIETTKFYLNQARFRIDPNPSDTEKFRKELMKDGETFKARTPQHKAWMLKVGELKHFYKPSIGFYMANTPYHYSSRLFCVDDILYCSVESEYDLQVPDFGTPMKASEFFKTIEDLDGKKNDRT